MVVRPVRQCTSLDTEVKLAQSVCCVRADINEIAVTY